MPPIDPPIDVNSPPGAFGGPPGDRWTNDTGKILYQLHVQFSHSCARCIQYANRIGPWWACPFHPGCNCTNIPIPPGKTAAPFVDFVAEMEALPPHQQAIAIGASNWKLIKSGVVEWGDVVTRGRIKPFSEVVETYKLTAADLKRAGVGKFQAARALERANDPAKAAEADAKRSAYAKLKAAGLTDAQIRAAVAARIKAKLGIGGAPTGGAPTKFPPPGPPPAAPGAAPKPEPPPKPKGPTGTPVGAALGLPGGAFGAKMKAAVGAIDAVHGDGSLKAIPVQKTESTGRYGAFWQAQPSGTPIKITVSNKGDHPELTLAHEVGHFIEMTAMPGHNLGRRNWHNDPLVKGWMDAVKDSRAVAGLTDLIGKREVDVAMPDGRTAKCRVDGKYIRYTLKWQELWARSYAQYVATRSGDKAMLEQLAAIVRPKDKPALYPTQWEAADFEPIAAAIDGIFKSLGWLQ